VERIKVASEVELLPGAVLLQRENSRYDETATTVKLLLQQDLNIMQASLYSYAE
ncbi:hypothetical protein HAX54_049674, partial [Datura stramonium]|nr:hypothetical protein [Datura stramonium]